MCIRDSNTLVDYRGSVLHRTNIEWLVNGFPSFRNTLSNSFYGGLGDLIIQGVPFEV